MDPVAEREPGEHLLAPQQPRPAGVFRALCGALRIFSSVIVFDGYSSTDDLELLVTHF